MGSSDVPITTKEELVVATERDGVEFLFAMFVDMHGKPCAKMVPVSAIDGLMADGAGFAGFAAGPMGQSPSSPDLLAMPDLSSYMPAPWRPGLGIVIVAILIPEVPRVVRVVRSVVLSIRSQPYIESAIAGGTRTTKLLVRHVLPNTLAPLIVIATAQLGAAILTEASLSFLGLGVPEPHPSWGRMLSESAAEYVRTAPWLVIFPGAAISLAVFGTNLFGDALRDILDPRLRN